MRWKRIFHNTEELFQQPLTEIEFSEIGGGGSGRDWISTLPVTS